MDQKKLIAKAHTVLEGNWRGTFTIPTGKLYPFQWFWDSGFVSLGWAHIDLARAIKEIESLLKGQWENGMIPHIIFHSETEKTYFPNWDFWDSAVNKGASKQVKTSGITQPPVLGFILDCLWQQHSDSEQLRAFIKSIYTNIIACHRFFYERRDPHKEGLFYIFHPWESGRDNSPLWDNALEMIDLAKANIPEYKRRDTQIVTDDGMRPTARQYDQYVYLLLLGRKHAYDGPGIAEESEFLIQDTLMNAVLVRSNEGLIRIGKNLGLDVGEVEEWQQQSKRAFEEKLWNDEIGMYSGYDLRQQKLMSHREIGGLTPLYSGIPSQERASLLNDYLQELHQKNYLICPSFDVESKHFESRRYWRGPIWPQMNWMLHHGCLRYGFADTAEIIKTDLIRLVEHHGFYEYFEAQGHLIDKHQCGYGGNNFSWTASSIIDLIS